MKLIVSVFMIVMGVAMAGIWTKDILAGEKVDLSPGFFSAHDEDGSLFWIHWFAEYGTAALLVAGGVGTLFETTWGPLVALVGLGALLYTSLNSLGWAYAVPERRAYAVPMIVGLLGGLWATQWLLRALLGGGF